MNLSKLNITNLDENLIQTLHAFANTNDKSDVVDATNLVNVGVIIVNEDGTLCTDKIDRDVAEIINKYIGFGWDIFNNQFHKSWEKVADAPLDQLVFEQLLHYFSTYGMELLTGSAMPVLPAEKCLSEELRPVRTNKFTIIRKVSYETLKDLFVKELTSVQKPNNLTALILRKALDIITNDIGDPIKLELDAFASFEMMANYCVVYGIVPDDPQTFLRCVVYLATGSTLLIKNHEVIEAIKNGCTYGSNAEAIESYFEHADIPALSTIFLRNKPLFLAFKANREIAPTINRLRRLAVKNHRPLPDVTVANIMSLLKARRVTDVANLINNMSLRNTIKLYNYALNALADGSDVIFNIRNGKTYTTSREIDKTSAELLKALCYAGISLKVSRRYEGKTFYIPSSVNYAVPVSEKQMISHIPYGTTLTADSNDKALCVSVAWDNYEGERTDIDLHLNSTAGSFGWNSSYRDGDKVLFSGDMTDATDGATETYRVSVEEDIPYLASVHMFSGKKDCPFKLFISSGNDFRKKDEGMVDISKALTTPARLDFKTGVSLSLGYLLGNTFTFYGGNLSGTIVPKRELYVSALNAIVNRCKNRLSLNELIRLGGGTIVTEQTDGAIDFSPEAVLSQQFFELLD